MAASQRTTPDGRYRARPAAPHELPRVRELWLEFLTEQRAAGFCENQWELPDVIDAVDARLEASVEAQLVAVLELLESGAVVGFLAGLGHEADSRVPDDAVLVTELFLQPAHRGGATGLPLYPCMRHLAAAAGKRRLMANTHQQNRLVLLVVKRLGFRPADALPFETPGHDWWDLPLE